MKIPKETVKKILERVNIVEVISEHTSISKNGAIILAYVHSITRKCPPSPYLQKADASVAWVAEKKAMPLRF